MDGGSLVCGGENWRRIMNERDWNLNIFRRGKRGKDNLLI